ncbi:hypothetical protein E2562_022190 [Oryza meyeriana var. granulata]|uniref:Uncharacterized protein n=1 Tax=Oryza meyeriana var. granulata TaxID=110450 RepID=A0A6G1DL82_9ORYZ|nr:hypothetical protein E2562_022190 [Oryza meyeriana var. granulata]
MNLSDDWRFLFPVSSVFAPPSLATPAAAYGPLLFSPLPPHTTLLALPSPFQPPHPSHRGLRHLLGHFVRSTSFLPFADLDSLSGTLLAPPSPPFPAPSNLLAVLRARSSRSLVLFFPSGENAEQVSYVTLDSVTNSTPLSPSVQSDGFMHPGHRIQQLAATASWSSWPSHSGDSLVEGFLLAATLYSVNWFKVETRSSGSPALVPTAKQAFDVAVVHACWSKHLQSECVVLLESGQLCWFDLDTRRGGKIKIGFGSEDDLGVLLSCEYGAQPWTVIIAGTKAILLVDLRYGDHGEYKTAFDTCVSLAAWA